MIADDNVDIANSLAMMLKILGNQVETTFDGLSAVEASERMRPTVVLLDIGMPKLTVTTRAAEVAVDAGDDRGPNDRDPFVLVLRPADVMPAEPDERYQFAGSPELAGISFHPSRPLRAAKAMTIDHPRPVFGLLLR